MTAGSDGFVEFLHEQAGDSLRAVRVYSPERHRPLYVREDVAARRTDEHRSRIVERAQEELSGKAAGEWAFMEDGLQAVVRVFGDAVVVNLPLSADRGVLVSLDADAAAHLHGFVADCREWLGAPDR